MSVKLRDRKLSNGTKQLFLDVYKHGQRRKEYLKLYLNGEKNHNEETKRMGEILRARRELEVQAELSGLGNDMYRKTSFFKYIEHLKGISRSEGMKNGWDKASDKLKTFLGGKDLLFGNITKGLMEDFKEHLLASGLHQNTAQKYFAHIKTALYHAMRHERIQTNPAQFITIKKLETLPKFLTFDEVKRLAVTECENLSVKNAFLFSCFSGLRSGDILALRWNQINEGYVQVTQRKTGNAELFPLSRQALRILEEQKSIERSDKIVKEFPEDVVFYLPRQSTRDKALKRWAKRAGLTKRISFHCARHTFATMTLTFGGDLYTTSKLLGHRDLKTTVIYAKVVDERKQAVVAALPVLS